MHLRVTIERAPARDAAAIEEATRGMRRELLALDEVTEVDLDGDSPPAGVKADASLVASLLVGFVSGGALAKVVEKVADWAGRRHDRTATLEIGGDKLAVGGITPLEQERLIREWLKRHAKADA